MYLKTIWLTAAFCLGCSTSAPTDGEPTGPDEVEEKVTPPGPNCRPWATGKCGYGNGCFAPEGQCEHVFDALRVCTAGNWQPVDACPSDPEPEPEPEPAECAPWAEGYCGLETQNCFAPPETCAVVFGGPRQCKQGNWVAVDGCDAESLRTRFGYPVGDKETWPAGGWQMWQVLSHHWDDQGGNHLAEDISLSGGEDAVDAPVYSVANGTVIFAKKNASSYKNVVLIRHEIEGEDPVCSFYAHVHELKVSAGDFVQGGQQIAQVIDWADAISGGSSRNTHLHYVFLNAAYCRAVERTGTEDFSGSGVCGYDDGEEHDLGWTDVDDAPATYTAVDDDCGAWQYEDGLIAPSQFIEAHR